MQKDIQYLIDLQEVSRTALDNVRNPKRDMIYPRDTLPHELMISGFVARDSRDHWQLTDRGIATINAAAASEDPVAKYYALPAQCRTILRFMLDGKVNHDPYIPASLRVSGFIQQAGQDETSGWVVTELAKSIPFATA